MAKTARVFWSWTYSAPTLKWTWECPAEGSEALQDILELVPKAEAVIASAYSISGQI